MRSVCDVIFVVLDLKIIPEYPDMFTWLLKKYKPAESAADPLYILLVPPEPIDILPDTSNLSAGDVVPIPTLPPLGCNVKFLPTPPELEYAEIYEYPLPANPAIAIPPFVANLLNVPIELNASAYTLPITSNLSAGDVVPIPTLPSLFMRILSGGIELVTYPF